MTDIVLFQLHLSICQRIGWIHYMRRRRTSQSACACMRKFLCLDMCDYHSLQCWVPLLRCRGSQPDSPHSHLHCISKYCSQAQIKHQVELQSHGTWDVREVGLKGKWKFLLVKERLKERRKVGLSLSASFLLKADPTGSLSLAQGAYADSMTFFPETRFYT